MVDLNQIQSSTGSKLGDLLRYGATKGVSKFKGLDQNVARRKIDRDLLNKAKKISDLDENLGKKISKTPFVGKAFETTKNKKISPSLYKKTKSYSSTAPITKAKKLALPLLATTGAGALVNKARKAHKKKIKKEIENKKNQWEGGNKKLAKLSQEKQLKKVLTKTASKLKKSAGAIKQLKKEVNEEKEKRASLQEKIEQKEKAFSQLIKFAQMGQIDYEDIPEELEKMASLKKEDFEVEMKALEKVASEKFLDYGGVGDKNSSDYEDPLIDFVMKNSGY